MKILSASASAEEIKRLVRQWVDLLGRGRFDEAADFLLPEIIPGNGSVSEKDFSIWTGQLLEKVILHGGTPIPFEGQDEFYMAAPIGESLKDEFENRLIFERKSFELFGKPYLGAVEVDLPLRDGHETFLSDLTARIYLRDLGNDQMALVLEDIHVL